MKVGDIIINKRGTIKRIIVGKTPANEWIVRPLKGKVLDIISDRIACENWRVVDHAGPVE